MRIGVAASSRRGANTPSNHWRCKHSLKPLEHPGDLKKLFINEEQKEALIKIGHGDIRYIENNLEVVSLHDILELKLKALLALSDQNM